MRTKYSNIILLLFAFLLNLQTVQAQEPQWIWYPGDFSIRLHQDLIMQRQERNEPYPPFWRIDSHNPVVLFRTTY